MILLIAFFLADPSIVSRDDPRYFYAYTFFLLQFTISITPIKSSCSPYDQHSSNRSSSTSSTNRAENDIVDEVEADDVDGTLVDVIEIVGL